MKKIITMLLLIQGGLMMAQTETVVSPNGKKITFNPNNWTLTGNSGTDGGINFLGTIDDKSLFIRTNNTKRIEINAAGNVIVGNPFLSTQNGFYMSFENGNFMGGARNTLGGNYAFAFGLLNKATVDKAAVLGGTGNEVSGTSSVVLGGEGNKVTDANAAVIAALNSTASATRSVVVGGNANTVSNKSSAIIAGEGNVLGGEASVIVGGHSNNVSGSHSVSIGNNNTIAAPNCIAIGSNINIGAAYDGNVVLTDNSTAQLVTTKYSRNAFMGAFANGYRFGLDRDTNNFFGMMFTNIGLVPYQPASGTKMNLGSTSMRWETLFVTNQVSVSSDLRLKTNIKPLQYGLKEILAINPISYSFKKDETNRIQLGVSAQEVQQILPETVTVGDDPEKLLGVTYTEMIPVLINAVKEQQKEITEQQKEITELKTLVNKLIQEQSASKK